MKTYTYINDIGEDKLIAITETPDKENKYYFTLWSKRTDDFCGSGKKSKEQINEFLRHYKIQETFEI